MITQMTSFVQRLTGRPVAGTASQGPLQDVLEVSDIQQAARAAFRDILVAAIDENRPMKETLADVAAILKAQTRLLDDLTAGRVEGYTSEVGYLESIRRLRV